MHPPTHHATGLRQSTHNQAPLEVVDQLRQRIEQRYSSIREAFMRLDRDNNGTLDRPEILAVLSEFNIQPRHLNALIASIDTNGDGVVSFSEFSAALRPSAGAFADRFSDRFVTNRHVVVPNAAGGQVFVNDNLGLARSGELRPDAELLRLPQRSHGDA